MVIISASISWLCFTACSGMDLILLCTLNFHGGPGHDEVVAMDHRRPSDITEDRLDLIGLVADDETCLFRIVTRETARDLTAFRADDGNGIAAPEIALDLPHASGKQALPA